MKRRLFAIVFILGLFTSVGFGTAAGAENLATARDTVADTPSALGSRSTVVAVEHDGSDTIGAQLSFELKGLFNRSSLFKLSEKDGPKIRLLLSTSSEFPSRPHIASAYAAVWTFSQGEGTLSFFLSREVGLVGADEVDSLAARLAEKTDGIAVRYGYLLQRE